MGAGGRFGKGRSLGAPRTPEYASGTGECVPFPHARPSSHPRCGPRGGRLGVPGRRGRLARVHPDGGLRGQLAGHRRVGRGPRDRRRRREPLPRRHQLALGHHAGPPRPRARRRGPPPARPRRPHHPARQREPGGGRARRGAGPAPPHGPTPPAVRRRRRGRGRAGVEDRLPVLAEPGRDRPGPVPRLRGRLPRRHRRVALRRRRRGPDRPVRPAPLPGRPGPRVRRPRRRRRRVRARRRARRPPGRRRGRTARAGCGRHAAPPAGAVRGARSGVPRPRRAARLRRGGRRLRADRHPVRVGAVRTGARPDGHGQGHHGRLPAHVGHRRQPPRLRRLPR